MGISLQDAQQIGSNAGLRTQYGVILPPGARVAAYVRSTGVQNGDDAFLATNLCTTLAQGLARARAGFGDFVVCLPGHAESVADATTFSAALQAGTRIIGVGRGSNTPTFTWATTAAQWLIAVADVQITGLRLQMTGINAVVLPINITAADVALASNEFVVSAAALVPANVITIAATGLRANISNNTFRGLATAIPTTIVTVAGVVTDVSIEDNEFICPAVAATGHINVTGVSLGNRFLRNYMQNTAAASTACISFAAAADGTVAYNTFGILSTGAPAAKGVILGAGIVKMVQNFTCTSGAAGVLTGTPSA